MFFVQYPLFVFLLFYGRFFTYDVSFQYIKHQPEHIPCFINLKHITSYKWLGNNIDNTFINLFNSI